MTKSKINYKVIAYALIGLLCLYLSYKIDWLFLIGSAIAIYLNQKELMGK